MAAKKSKEKPAEAKQEPEAELQTKQDSAEEEKEDLKRYTVKTVETKEEPFFEEPQKEEEVTSSPKKSSLPLILIIISVLLLILALGAGAVIYIRGSKTQEPITSDETITPTSSPIPTPTLEKKDLSIEVLNGLGVAGTAAEAKTFLEEKGYVVGETGNADNFNFSETTVSIKDSKKDYLELLIEDLSENYSVASESSTLSEEEEFDAVVTVGQ